MTQIRSGTVLAPADHEQFLENGYVVIRGAVPGDVVRRTVQALGDSTGKDVQPAIEACMADNVLDAVGELLGPDNPFVGHRVAGNLARPYEPEKADSWNVNMQGGGHFDQTYATLTADCAAIRAFVFLTKVQHRGGAFLYAPGSHRKYREIMQRGPTTHPWFDGRLVRVRAGDPNYRPAELQEFLAEPGDLLLYHIHLGHSGSDNVSDPQTRLALTTSYAPERRIDPGDKPLDEMSTMERACSIRWLRETYGPQFLTYPIPADAHEALVRGFGGPAEIIAHAETRFAGRHHRWYITADNPSLVRHATSDDWVRWAVEEPFIADGPVTALHHRPLVDDAFLTISTADAAIVLRTEDYETWEPAARVDGITAACLFETDEESSRQGLHLFGVDPRDPSTVLRLTVGNERDADGKRSFVSWSDRAVVATASSEIGDVTIFPTSGEPGFAMVMDAEPGGPIVVRNDDGATYEEDAQPLLFDAPSTPRRLCVYEQAHLYWLVTYIREGRVFWGSVDWAESSPTLREVSTARAFERALQIVGLV